MTESDLRSQPFAVRWGMRLCFLHSQRRAIGILVAAIAAVSLASLSIIGLLNQGPRHSVEIGSAQERALLAYLTLADPKAAKTFSERIQASIDNGSPHTRVTVSQAKEWISASSPLALAALSKAPLPSDLEGLRASALATERLRASLTQGMGPLAQCSFRQTLAGGFAPLPHAASCWEPDFKLGFWICHFILFSLISVFAWMGCSVAEYALIENPFSFFRRRREQWMAFRADADFRRVERALIVFASKRARPAAEAKKSARL